MSMYVEGTFTTKFGKIGYAITEATHVSLRTDRNEQLVYRGNEYNCNLHLHIVNGEWGLKNYQDFYLSRPNGPNPTPVCNRAIKLELTQAWQAYAAEHPELLVQAEAKHLVREIRSRDEKLAALEQQAKALRDERNEFSDQLSKLATEHNLPVGVLVEDDE